ncbi:MAG: chorismate synthase, partial [Ruminococcaceae bacterium]|nr:chorismate synthase [Oscillospiraceae bacterium]
QVLDGLPPGFLVDEAELARQMARRAPGRTPWSTPRRETDQVEILSGIYRQRTNGAPLSAIIRNQDTRSADYEQIKMLPRPGHADITGALRYRGHNDPRGSGHFSGRLTAPLVFAGAVCRQILATRSIAAYAHIEEIAGIRDQMFDPLAEDMTRLESPQGKEVAVLDDLAGKAMIDAVLQAAAAGDSVGGSVECLISGMPAGLGNPMFGGLESRLSSLIYGIPAVKGVSFGRGFAVAQMRGSAFNDQPYMHHGRICYRSNNSGGIIGGISNGLPLLFQVAIRPPASIAQPQQTINMATGQPDLLAVRGRHDPCIVPRVVPVIEAAAALFALDVLLDEGVLSHD